MTDDEHKALWANFISRRCVNTPCKECHGLGTKIYGSTATWRGGAGGQMMTTDACDVCWGSGDAAYPWLNLRHNEYEKQRLNDEIAKLTRSRNELRNIRDQLIANRNAKE